MSTTTTTSAPTATPTIPPVDSPGDVTPGAVMQSGPISGAIRWTEWSASLASPDAKDMPTANSDTYDRYYVVDVFNLWQELEHCIGRRTTGTKG